MRLSHALTSAVAATALLTSCSSEPQQPPADEPSSTSSTTPTTSPSAASPSTSTEPPSATPEPSAPTLTITIQGNDVSPNGERIEVAPGEPLVVGVTSDRAGELHVHSKPEQFVEFGEGSTVTELVIDIPGVVEVEDHETGAVVAQIQVQ